MNEDRNYSVGSGNVFADLELPDPDDLLAKAKLVRAIDVILAERGWAERRAAAALGVDERRLAALLRGHFEDFSIGRLFQMLNALDYDVAIEIAPRRPSCAHASVTVALNDAVESGSSVPGA